MAKIFRFSGYLVSNDSYSSQSQIDGIKDFAEADEMWQQLHVEESECFELDGEDKENCDLALLTRHFKKDNSNMQFDRPLPKKGEKYKHFKLGKIVTVIGLSRHTETEEITVVYEYEGTIWNRPLEMFMSEVDEEKYPNVSQKYRFEKVVGRMKDNMLIFNDNETHTEIRYVIAKYSNLKSKWHHYLDFPNIEDAKEHLETVRKIHPDIEFRVFEKIEQATVNMLDEEFI